MPTMGLVATTMVLNTAAMANMHHGGGQLPGWLKWPLFAVLIVCLLTILAVLFSDFFIYLINSHECKKLTAARKKEKENLFISKNRCKPQDYELTVNDLRILFPNKEKS